MEDNHDNMIVMHEAMDNGTWYWDLKSNVVVFEKSWRELLLYDESEEISWADIIYPDDLFSVVAKILRLGSGETCDYYSRHRIRNGNGDWCWVQETAKADLKGNEDYVSNVKIVTRLVENEEVFSRNQVVLREKLSQSTKMESIGQLSAGIAHDFNNLLAGVLGYAELSMDHIDEGGDINELKGYLTQIMSAGSRAKELISQMLAYSRISPSNEEEAPVCLLKPVLSEVVQLGRSSIPRSIDVNYRVMDDEVRVKLHPVNLHQILLNLVINARDAINEFGKIELSQTISNEDFVCSACKKKVSGEFVVVSVHDTGHGISDELKEKIFAPFFTTKEIGKGTGMGLAVVQGLAHSLNGHIVVNSKEGVGTTVRLYLPAVEEDKAIEEVQESKKASRGPPNIKGVRILVIDDEDTIVTLLTELLTMYGAEVTAFNRSDKALGNFIRHPDEYDIVITDATMPEISGIELSRAILQLRPQIPILICTGYSSSVNEESAIKNGISGYMQKPLEIPKLLEWIEQRVN